MTVTIDLRPDLEASLAARAAERGLSLAQYVGHLIEAQFPEKKLLTAAERAKLWRESVRNLPPSAPLSDEAISRESIYAERG
jgi:hypothetical protein